MDPSCQPAHLRKGGSRLLTNQYGFLPKLRDVSVGQPGGLRPTPNHVGSLSISASELLLSKTHEISGAGRLIVVRGDHY